MRSHLTILLVLLALSAAGHVKAQTWTQPIELSYTSVQTSSGNTCEASDTIDIYEGWFNGSGPDIVYELRNRQPVGSPHYSSAIITFVPNYSYPMVDFEMFACQAKYGNFAENCAIEADNLYSPQQPFQLTIPNQFETFRLVVTAANFFPTGYNPCVPYTLVVQRLP
jgi:hypothetical protein